MSLGQNGLFKMVKKATQEYKNAQISEEKGINDLYSEMMIATNDSSQITISIEELKKLIKEEVQKEVKERDSAPIFIDFDNLLTTITEPSKTWVATEDCVVVSELTVTNGWSAIVYVDDVCVNGIGMQGATQTNIGWLVQTFYVKKGSKIRTREQGNYDLKIYGIK